jgi:hypothetical protein
MRTTLLAASAVVVTAAVAATVTLGVLRGGAPTGAAGPPSGSLAAMLSGEPARASRIAESAAGRMAMPEPQPRKATPVEPRAFDADAAIADVRALEAFGPRAGGSAAEARAAEYLRDRLTSLGLQARVEEFSLTGGAKSRNVVARIAGSSESVLVLGGHYDTKPPSPGANDNASGCAALLEIATILSAEPIVPTVEIVFFGSEEIVGSDPDDHHFGSRHRVTQMSAAERARTIGMISVDMVGFGPDFHSRTMGKGPMTLSDMLLARARAAGVRMTYRRDPGASGWSDHEAYELAGIPVSWIEWRDDPVYHTARDTAGHLSPAKIATAGTLVLDFVRSLDAQAVGRLLER